MKFNKPIVSVIAISFLLRYFSFINSELSIASTFFYIFYILVLVIEIILYNFSLVFC